MIVIHIVLVSMKRRYDLDPLNDETRHSEIDEAFYLHTIRIVTTIFHLISSSMKKLNTDLAMATSLSFD